MKLTPILLSIMLAFSSCYSYKVYEEGDPVEVVPTTSNRASAIRAKVASERDDMVRSPASNTNSFSRSPNADVSKSITSDVEEANKTKTISLENVTLKNLIQPKGFYKIDFQNRTLKIEAKKWQGDTLHAIVKGKPKHELKMHENDIHDLKIRKFSKGQSDMLTIAAYALGAVGIFILLK